MLRRLGFVLSIIIAILFFQAGFSQERIFEAIRRIFYNLG